MTDIPAGFKAQESAAPTGFGPQLPPAAPEGFVTQDQAAEQAAGPFNVVRNFVAPYERMWDTLKNDFSAYGKAQEDQLNEAKQGIFSWEGLKGDFQRQMITGKTLWDAATSVLTALPAGLANAGLIKPGGWLLGHAVPGGDPAKEVPDAEAAVSDALLAAMPSRGLWTARTTGVFGPAPKPLTEGTPVEAAVAAVKQPLVPAESAMPAVADGPATLPEPIETNAGPPAVLDKAGNIRLDLLKDSATPDALGVIRAAAAEAGAPDAFAAARRGDIPLAQVDALGQALGIDPTEINVRGLGRLMRNDQEVRMAIQGMLQSAEDVSAAAKTAKQTGALADLMKFQELRMRHSILQEQVAGLTAEWGRTGNVFQEFSENVKDAQSLGKFLQAKKGESLEDLRKLVDATADLPKGDVAKFMNAQRKPTFWDKLMFYRANSLLSGVFSHVKYAATMVTYAVYDAGVITPVAAAIGKAKQLAGLGDGEHVMAGEGPARLYGYVLGVPKAFVESYEAMKSGLRVPSGRRIAEGRNPYTQQVPIEGKVGTIVGLPSRVINGLHAFIYSLGRRAELEAQGYRSAAKAGLSPFNGEFWQHQQGVAMYPSEDMMDAAEANGDRLTFTAPLGDTGLAFQSWLRKSRIGQLVFPFTRVPWNIAKAAQEGSPLAWLGPAMRENLAGKNGGIAQDTQIARLISGSALGAMAAHWASNDRITGGGPNDTKVRAEWLLTHKPYSIRIGDHWIEYWKFPGIGPIMGTAADLVGIAHKTTEGDYAEASARLTVAAAHFLQDPMGAQGLYDAIKASENPKEFGQRYINDFGTSFLPYSTLLGQTASAMDPHMREAKSFVDALKLKIPGERETLFPVRDWTGIPVANDRADLDAIFSARAVNQDPVDIEMQRLNIKPTKPPQEIGGVKLTDEEYDYFQTRAGVNTRSTLEQMVTSPGWQKAAPAARANLIRSVVETNRAAARMQTQAQFPHLLTDGVKLQQQRILGGQPVPANEWLDQ